MEPVEKLWNSGTYGMRGGTVGADIQLPVFDVAAISAGTIRQWSWARFLVAVAQLRRRLRSKERSVWCDLRCRVRRVLGMRDQQLTGTIVRVDRVMLERYRVSRSVRAYTKLGRYGIATPKVRPRDPYGMLRYWRRGGLYAVSAELGVGQGH